MKSNILTMAIQRNYVIGIIDHNISEVNEIIFSHSDVTMGFTSFMYFGKLPVDQNKYIPDTTFFQLRAEDESSLNRKLNDLIRDLDKLNGDYVLKDEESGKLLVIVDFGGTLYINFDKLKIIKKGTFKQIDDLKQIETDLGYTRGFNPNFRPLEDRSVENMDINPEVIYLISDSQENLMKFKDYVSDKILEINSDFELDFVPFRKG